MLQPDRMFHLQLLARREDKARLIELLADAKAVHLEAHKKVVIGGKEVDSGNPLPSAKEISDALTKVKNLLSKLKKEDVPGMGAVDLAERLQRVDALAHEFAEHETRLATHEKALDTVAQQRKLLTLLHGYQGPLDAIFRTKTVESVVYKRGAQAQPDALKKIKSVAHLSSREGGAMTVRKSDADAARSAIKGAGYALLDLAPLAQLEGTTTEAHAQLEAAQRDAERALADERAFRDGFQEHVPFLKQSARTLTLELLKAQAPLQFGATRNAILIKGFIPTREAHGFRKRLEASEIPAVLEFEEAHDAPTKLRNPPTIRNFEELIKLYTLPRYHEIDPTSIMAFTFPLFFGFMLGDIGYGLTLLILFLWLRAKAPAIKAFADIIILSAISSMIFGVIYGEVFGLEHIFGIELHPILHRTEGFNEMFMIALGIGVAHLFIGLILGIINEAHHEGWWHAFLKKGSWIVLVLGALAVAASQGLLHEVIGDIHVPAYVGYTLIALAVAGIYAGEKLQGIFELPGIFGNILSYARLVAIGLSSVYIALVVNDLGGGLVHKGGLWIAIGVLVIVFGHALNVALGLLGPFLHSLRLHYAEFFMKFYVGGGKQYQPFGAVEES